jgi:hypothetical protein
MFYNIKAKMKLGDNLKFKVVKLIYKKKKLTFKIP